MLHTSTGVSYIFSAFPTQASWQRHVLGNVLLGNFGSCHPQRCYFDLSTFADHIYTPLHENSIPRLINVFDFCHFFNCIHHYLSKWWHIIEQVNLYSPLWNISYIPSDMSCYQYFFVCIVRLGSLFGIYRKTHFICFPPYITLTNNTQSNVVFLFSFGLVVLWFFPPFYRFH